MIQANAIGRSSKTVREFLEKNHKDDMTRDESIKLTIKSLLEVVQTGAKNIEISVLDGYNKITVSFILRFTAHTRLDAVYRAWNSLRLRRLFKKSSGRKKLVRVCRYSFPPFLRQFLHRGREEEITTGGHCGWPGSNVISVGGST